jgi:hypothetical protein
MVSCYKIYATQENETTKAISMHMHLILGYSNFTSALRGTYTNVLGTPIR